MASSSTFAVVLVFVALGGVRAAEAAGRPSGTLQGWNGASIHDNDENTLQRMSNIPVSALMVSPLDADRTAKYLTLINDDTLGAHSKEFCQEARLQCSADMAIVDPTLRISRSSLVDQELFQQTRDLVEATRAMQFSRTDIEKDSEVALPENLHDSYPAVAFLPQSLAEKMPFTSGKMKELFEKLSIPQDSNLAIMMSRTVAQCEAQEQGKDIRTCVTSLEDMKTFVSSNLPQNKRIVALERFSSIPGAGESGRSNNKDNNNNNNWKVVDAKLYDRAVVCRNSVFPYAVFECHDTSKTSMPHIYQVEMMQSHGTDNAYRNTVRQVAACHDTTAAAHGHTGTNPADTVSAAAPAQACHWLTDSLIWAPAD